MSQELCRLCLGSERLICTFDARLSNAQELRLCVLLCTGVEIKPTDVVTKMVCHSCLEIATKLTKFRTTAVANDKTLKDQVGQEYITPLCNQDDIVKLHESILESISHIDVAESIEQFYEHAAESDVVKINVTVEPSADSTEAIQENQPTVEVNQKLQSDDLPVSESETEPNIDIPAQTFSETLIENRHDIDPSVEQLFQIYPNLILEDDVQKFNVAASLVLDNSEANKYLDQLQYYVEAEQEKISSLNEQYDDISDNLEDSKITENSNLDSDRDPEKFYRTDYRSNYYADPDYYVYKTRKRKFDELSNESYSDFDAGGSDSESGEVRPTPQLITRSSRYKFSRISYTNSDSESELLGFSKAKDEIRVCEYCDKICYSRSQLRHHERTHRKCQVCHKVFRTDEALEMHLRNVCYRIIEENQPFLQLLRIDDHPLVVKQYQPAFEYFFSRMNDETYEGYGKRDENFIFDKNFPLYHTEEHIANENAYILDTLKKFQSIKYVPIKRNKMNQTRKSDIIIKYSNQNQIILEDLFSDLLTYKVPIQMVVDQKISAHISYTTKPTLNKTMHHWSGLRAIDVAVQPKLLNLSSAPPVLHFFSPTPSVLKTVTNKNVSSVRPKIVNKNKGGSTKTVASNAVKIVQNLATTPKQQQIYNITRILTPVTTHPRAQTYTVTKTTVNETRPRLQSNVIPIKREEPSEPLNSITVIRQPSQMATTYRTNANSCQNVIFKVPFNPSKQNNPAEPPIKEELPSSINDVITRHVIVPKHVNNSKRAVFRFPYNSNPQNQQHQMYQNMSQNSNSNVYQPENIRLQTRNQYLIPVTSGNSQHCPNPSQNVNLNNLLLLKNTGALSLNSPNMPSPSNVINGNVFFPSRNSPVNKTSSPNPSTISSPNDNTAAPFLNSNTDSLNTNSYSTNSYSASKTPLPYSYSSVPENSGAYDTDPFPPNAFPSENQISYNTGPYPPSDTYSPNGYRSNSSYSPSSFQSSDNTYASNYNQYIPPYNPMGEYVFNDGQSMHLLPPQHLSTSAVGGKVFLRVKQPWELNQT